MLRIACAIGVAWLGASAVPVAGPTSFKVATWNVRSGMGITGLAARQWRHDTVNCTDRSKPLNAWGVGLPQRELARIKADPAIIALAVQEAWHCATPESINAILGFGAASREQNGVALLARHGFAGAPAFHRIGARYDSWIVGGAVCLDAACSATLPMFSTHWGGRDAEFPVQARNVIDFLSRRPDPHLFMGDLNVFKIDRWNPRVPCTSPDSPGRTHALALIEEAGYVDVWKATQPGEGWTGMSSRPGCGSPEGNLYKRIDYVFAKQLRVLGAARFARVAPGAEAPSDHAGVIAEIALPPSTR